MFFIFIGVTRVRDVFLILSELFLPKNHQLFFLFSCFHTLFEAVLNELVAALLAQLRKFWLFTTYIFTNPLTYIFKKKEMYINFSIYVLIECC